MIPRLLVLAAAAAALAPAQSPCPPRGLALAVHGGRLGDSWSAELAGAPHALGFLGFDLLPGPAPSPIGTVCLGLSPALVTRLFALDNAGLASAGGTLPASAPFAGLTLHLAAVAVDPSQPSGFALSNGAALTARQPRLFFVSPGSVTPFGATPGAFAALNVLTDDVAFAQPLPSNVRGATFVRARHWLVLLLGNGTLAGFDGTTGANVFNLPLAGASASASQVLAAPDGELLLLLSAGTPPNPFGGGTPGAVHVVSLSSAAVVTTIPLAAGNPDAMLLAPAPGGVFLRLLDGVVLVDYLAGLASTVPLPTGFGGLVDWQLAGGMLYVLHSGQAPGPFGSGQPAALSAIDTNTLLVSATNPLALAAPVQFLRAGPGTTGPSLYVYSAPAGTLAEFAQGTLAPTASVAVGSGIAAMELSALGAEWLLLCDGPACGGPALLSMFAYTTIVTPVAGLPSPVQPLIAVSPSAGIGKACLAVGTATAAPFATDPFVGVPGAVALPVAANLFSIVRD